MKSAQLLNVFVAAVLLGTTAFAAAQGPGLFSLPETYALPPGINPEGITAKDNSSRFFIGSLADGSVYELDAVSGEGRFVVAGAAGRIAVGMDFDPRTGLLYVAGGTTGKIFVYHPASGQLVREFDVGAAPEESFVNDVIVTQRAVYFTDSFLPVIYKVKLKRAGRLRGSSLKTIQLKGDFDFSEGEFNANGIEQHPATQELLIVNSQAGKLYRTNESSGETREIILDQALPNADGILLSGNKLFVVQNFINQISVVELESNLHNGEIVKVISRDSFDIPTTVDLFGLNLLTINARFTTPDAVDFTVTNIDLLKD